MYRLFLLDKFGLQGICNFYRFAGMEHVLDNPAWSALNSGNRHLANGNSTVKYFDKEVSPIVGLQEYTHENLELLYSVLPDSNPKLLITSNELDFPKQWKVLGKLKGFQMVYELNTDKEPEVPGTIELTNMHVPQMLALTQLTSPGPFASKTIEFGHYRGVFNNNMLAAMAGQRLHAFNYTEISAVCTHPNHLGNGYARRLLQYHIYRMQLTGTLPFLHVRYDNERAIKVYEDLGFAVRIPVHFHFIQKNVSDHV
jgi:ribosomal protein S18 acetylase RimI-like enzyme